MHFYESFFVYYVFFYVHCILCTSKKTKYKTLNPYVQNISKNPKPHILIYTGASNHHLNQYYNKITPAFSQISTVSLSHKEDCTSPI